MPTPMAILSELERPSWEEGGDVSSVFSGVVVEDLELEGLGVLPVRVPGLVVVVRLVLGSLPVIVRRGSIQVSPGG